MVQQWTAGEAGRRRRGRDRCAGLTLPEVLITLALIAVAISGIALFRYNISRSARRTTNALTAAQLIERQLEETRAYVAANRQAHWPPASGSSTDSASGIVLEWAVGDVTDPGGRPVEFVREVRYVARWQSPRPDSVVVSSCLSRDF